MSLPFPEHTLFISDLHLDAKRPDILALCLRFLRERAPRAQALYILGDLFEAWVGDDDDTPAYQAIQQGLRALSDSGTALFFMCGNRDFLVGNAFASATACRLLPDPSVIDLYGQPTLLMHGDSLCVADSAYQLLRAQLRHPDWQALFLSKPLAERRRMALDLRRQSQQANQEKNETIMDVSPDAVLQALREHGARRLIHGHTHRPAVHHLEVNGQPAERIVLADWYANGSALAVSAKGYEFISLN